MTRPALLPFSRRNAHMLIILALGACTESSITEPVIPQHTLVTAPMCFGKPATIYPGNPGAGTIQDYGAFTVMTGTPGADVIVGSSVQDFIDAGDGNDRICTLEGPDYINAGPGADLMDGGDDNGDHIDYILSPAGINITLGGGNGKGGFAEGDRLRNIENLYATQFDDVIRGDANANSIVAGGGHNVLFGGGGPDVLEGGTDDDVIHGGDGDDYLIGQGGNDTFDPGSGANTIDGGAGQDRVMDLACADVVTSVEKVVRTTCVSMVDHFQIDFVDPPGDIVEWTPFDVRITAKDAANRTVKSYVGTTDPAYIGHSLHAGLGTTAAFKAGTTVFTAYAPDQSVYTITAFNNFTPHGASAQFVPQFAPSDPAQSQIFANNASLPADGTSTTIIIVQLKEQYGHNLNHGGGTVVLTTSAGTLSDGTTSGATVTAVDHFNGTVTLLLTAPNATGTATITGTMNAVPITSQATVIFN